MLSLLLFRFGYKEKTAMTDSRGNVVHVLCHRTIDSNNVTTHVEAPAFPYGNPAWGIT